MRGFAKWVFAAVGALAVVSLVAEPLLAQEQQRGRQRQGQRGQRGGRGFGRGGFGFGGGSSAGLLGNPQVQTELKLSDEQKTAMEKVVAEQRAAVGELRDIEDRAQRVAKMGEVSQKADKEAEALLEEDQKKRLAEIQLQQRARFLGARVFTGEDVSTKLKLTEEQQKQLAELSEATRTAMEEAREGLERQELFAKMNQLREQEREKAVALLTEEQQEQWKAMLGKPFELEFRGFGGRGRGGRGGQDGQRGERRRPQ